MTREERIAIVTSEIDKFDTIRPTLSAKAIAEAIVDRWEESERHIGEQIHRYFVAVYGEVYGYRAPETFPNTVEAWMLCVARGNMEAAEEYIVAIEEHFKSVRNG